MTGFWVLDVSLFCRISWFLDCPVLHCMGTVGCFLLQNFQKTSCWDFSFLLLASTGNKYFFLYIEIINGQPLDRMIHLTTISMQVEEHWCTVMSRLYIICFTAIRETTPVLVFMTPTVYEQLCHRIFIKRPRPQSQLWVAQKGTSYTFD